MRLTTVAANYRRHLGTKAVARPERRGTTLVELTVVLVLLALIVGGLLSVTDRQQRFYREASATSAGRSQVRQAAAILPAELRGLVPGDIIQARDSALEFRSTIASGVVCERGADWVAIGPLRSAGARTYRGELLPPAAGDIARILVADPDDPSLDRWVPLTLADVSEDSGACAGGPFVDPSDAGQPRLRLTLGSELPAAVTPGTPLRVTRPVRYSLYRSSDRLWYLGANEWSEGRWSGIQPVSGPYAAYGRGAGGIRFEYLDESGVALDEPLDPARVALVRLAIRAHGVSSGSRAHRAGSAATSDSVVVEVALRNRARW